MTSAPEPLTLPPFLDYVFDVTHQYEAQIGIYADELGALRTALQQGLAPATSHRDGFNEDHYIHSALHLYVRSDLITLLKDSVVVTGSLARQQVSVRAPRKHPQFGYEVDAVIAVEPFPSDTEA